MEHWFHRWKRPWRKQVSNPSAVLLSAGGRGKPVPVPAWSFPAGLELVHDPSPARWIEERLATHDWATVGSVVPEGFESYARILHPAYRGTGASLEPVSWSEVAAMTGRTLHPLAQFARLANLGDRLNDKPEWGQRPDIGDLPTEVAVPLERILRSFTQRPDHCWFCVWFGWGDFFALRDYDEAAYPHVETHAREYLLLRGPLEMVSQIHSNGGNDPSIWWPDDHAWCVATEIDLDCTYVGGSAECIEELTNDPGLEVLPAALEDRVDFGSDTINT